jgi:hypothetical protein
VAAIHSLLPLHNRKMRVSSLFELLLLTLTAEVAASPTPLPSATLSARDSTSTACGKIVNDPGEFIHRHGSDNLELIDT